MRLVPQTRKMRIAALAGLIVLLAALGAGLWFWREGARYKASPAYAVDELNKAIAEKNADRFAALVDIPHLISELTRAEQKLEERVPLPEGFQPLSPQAMQRIILAVIKGENAGAPLIFRVAALPDNLHEQLVQNPFKLTRAAGDLALAETFVRHPALGDNLPLTLYLARTDAGWKVMGLANATDLVARYQARVEAETRRIQEERIRELGESKSDIARLLPDLSCTAQVATISGNVPLLVLSVEGGKNPGPETVDSWGITLTLTTNLGDVAATPLLRGSNKVVPSGAISGTWHLEVDEQEYQRLQSLSPLVCRAQVAYAILDNGKILKAFLD